MNWLEGGRKIARELMRITPLREALRKLSLKGLLPSQVWKRLPVEVTFPIVLPDGRSFFYSATPNDVIARVLYWRGLQDWECETISCFYELAKSAQTILDIGANTGFYTLLALVANPVSRVIALEPVPRVFKKLYEHIHLNHFDDRCELYMVAASSFVGTALMLVPFGDLPTSASLNPEGFRGLKGEKVEVPVITIDRVVQDREVDLAKVDVEGFELEVLKGMRQTLYRSRPALFIECLPDGPYIEVEQFLRSFGYSIYKITSDGPVPAARVTPERMHYENWLFVHPKGRIKV